MIDNVMTVIVTIMSMVIMIMMIMIDYGNDCGNDND